MRRIENLGPGALLLVATRVSAYIPCASLQEFLRSETKTIEKNSVVIYLGPDKLKEVHGRVVQRGEWIKVLHKEELLWLEERLFPEVLISVPTLEEAKRCISKSV